ncbi:hypothetical protein D3C86_1453810 [compost metagenome]
MQAGDQGHLVFPGVAAEDRQGVPGQYRVHRRHRLIGQQHFGRLVQHPGNAHALQLAAGQLLALGEQLVTQVQLDQCRPRPRNIHRMQQAQQAFGKTPLAELSGQHRRDHPLPRWQWRRLVNQADARPQLLTSMGAKLPGVLAEHLNRAVVRAQGGGQHVEQARLAGTGRADDCDLLTGTDVQVDLMQRTHAIAVGEADPVQMQGHFSRSAARAASSMPL